MVTQENTVVNKNCQWQQNSTCQRQREHFAALVLGKHPIQENGVANSERHVNTLKEFLWDEGLLKQKFRLVIDYDPEFPLMEVSVFGMDYRTVLREQTDKGGEGRG